MNHDASLDHRQWLAAELHAVLNLARDGELSAHGLRMRRFWLRRQSIVDDATRLGLLEQRAEALHAVCMAWAALEPHTLDVFRAVGDLLEQAPDDASELAGDRGTDDS